MRRVCQLQIVSTEGSPHRGVPLVGHLLRCGPISSSVVFTVLQVELALVEDAVAVMHGLATEAWSNVCAIPQSRLR